MSNEQAKVVDLPNENTLRDTEVTEGGLNKNTLYCLRCNCKILKQNLGKFTESEFKLPEMRKKRDASEGDTETLKYFWLVNDMYTFENMGFTNTVDNIKYLACADCEVGPVGLFDQDTKNIYVALSRVKYQ